MPAAAPIVAMPGDRQRPEAAAAVSGSALSVRIAVVKLPELMIAPRLMPNCFRMRALHLGDDDAQHHLLLALDGEQVDHGLGRIDVVAGSPNLSRRWSRCSTDSSRSRGRYWWWSCCVVFDGGSAP